MCSKRLASRKHLDKLWLLVVIIQTTPREDSERSLCIFLGIWPEFGLCLLNKQGPDSLFLVHSLTHPPSFLVSNLFLLSSSSIVSPSLANSSSFHLISPLCSHDAVTSLLIQDPKCILAVLRTAPKQRSPPGCRDPITP